MESFEEVETAFTPMIHYHIRKLSIYKNQEEYFQLGLIALWQAYQRFNPAKGSFSSYAYVSIRGAMMQEISKSRKEEEKTICASDEFFEPFEGVSELPFYEEDRILTLCKNNKLTENQIKWVLYHCYPGFQNKQIAAIENVSVSAVKAWRKGALEKLRRDSLNCLEALEMGRGDRFTVPPKPVC